MSNRIKEIALLGSTQYLNLYEVSYENKVGNTKQWTVASRRKQSIFEDKILKKVADMSSDAVIIAAYHIEQKKLVLVNQFRVPINGRVVELPAGLIESQEAMERCVARELMEETGLELVSINYNTSYQRIYASPGMTDENLDIVFCTCTGNVSTEFLEEDEELEVLLVNREEAVQLLCDRPTIDIKAMLVLQQFALTGEKIFTGELCTIEK